MFPYEINLEIAFRKTAKSIDLINISYLFLQTSSVTIIVVLKINNNILVYFYNFIFENEKGMTKDYHQTLKKPKKKM
jgi:hypothetical protein